MVVINRYKYLIIICFFLFSFSISRVYASISDLPLLGKVIYLDAGHGGVDAGAILNNLKEKDINLKLVMLLRDNLVSKGAMVYLTREGDYDLSNGAVSRKRNDLYNRAKMINDSKADLYISIHLNSTNDGRWRGLQIFYNSINKENKLFAEKVNEILVSNLSYVREIKNDNSYYMYKHIKVPGILIEAGFISNASDNYLLRNKDYQDKLINNIVYGIINYYS